MIKLFQNTFSKSLFLLGFALLSSCYTTSVIPQKAQSVYITKGAKFELLSLEELNKNISLNQYLKAKYKHYSYGANVVTDISPKDITIFGLTEFGIGGFTVKYDGSNIDYQFPPIVAKNKRARPEYIVAHMQLVYYPLEMIQKNIDSKIAVTQNVVEKQLKRVFSKDGKPFIEITYDDFLDKKKKQNLWQSKVSFVNLERDYNFTITNLK